MMRMMCVCDVCVICVCVYGVLYFKSIITHYDTQTHTHTHTRTHTHTHTHSYYYGVYPYTTDYVIVSGFQDGGNISRGCVCVCVCVCVCLNNLCVCVCF